MAKYSLDDDDDDDYDPRPRRPRARMSPFRFISPGTFGLAVLLFFLPWTDVSCQAKGMKSEQLVTQSGYQSAVGEVTEGEAFKKQGVGPPGAKADKPEKLLTDPKKGGKDGKEEKETAPLLWVYLLLLVGGVAAPAFIAPDKVRGAVVVGLAGCAHRCLFRSGCGVQAVEQQWWALPDRA